MEFFVQIALLVAITTAIVIALPCLLVRPLLVAIADRISGKKVTSKEIQDMKNRITFLEHELRSVKVQVIGIESAQEFSNKLLENQQASKERTANDQES